MASWGPGLGGGRAAEPIEVIADRIKHGELPASALNVSFR